MRIAPAVLAAALLLQPVALAAEETARLPIPGDRVALDYEAYKGGFRVLEVEIGLDLTDPGHYRMGFDAELVGAPALIFSYRIGLDAEGRLAAKGPAPDAYRQESVSGDKAPEWLALDFADGTPEVSGNPNPAEEPRPTVTWGQRRGTLDPLSAVLQIVMHGAVAGDCALSAPIFDGRRRFDVVSEDRGEVELAKSTINVYSGPARLCRLTVTPLAGYRFDERDKKTLPRQIEAYLASPAPGLPAMPVRLVVETGWGTVLVHLVGLKDHPKG